MAPILAGVVPDDLEAPLNYLNVYHASKATHLHQLIEEISTRLNKPAENALAYQRAADKVIELAGRVTRTPPNHSQEEVNRLQAEIERIKVKLREAQTSKPVPKPNVAAKRGRVIWASPDDRSILFEVPAGGSSTVKAIVADFRYQPRSDGDDAAVWYDVQASVSYLDESGHELVHVGRGWWLGQQKTTVKFPLLENRSLVIAVLANSGEWMAADDETTYDLNADVKFAKIVLNDDNGLVLPIFMLQIDLTLGAVGHFV
jgi:hypothetical protein